jgi:hypothetical protein
MSNNLTIDLKAREDKDGKTFYIGKLKAPVLIDAEKGAVFLVFICDKGEEQLQIGLMENKNKDEYSK